MKIALVTGANKGIGIEIARQLALRGIHVLMGARDEERGRAAERELLEQGCDVEYVRLDMEKSSDLAEATAYISEKFGRLDILINNAGIQIESDIWSTNTSTTIPMDVLRQTFDVNFFGLVELTQLLLPLLRKSEAGRIVNLTSILASLNYHAAPGSNTYNTKTFAYNASKTAVNSFTIHLAHALKDTNIKVNAAHPGWVKTDMGGAGAKLSLEEGASTAVELALLGDDGFSGKYIHLDKELPW